jgi:hypothetical protein
VDGEVSQSKLSKQKLAKKALNRGGSSVPKKHLGSEKEKAYGYPVKESCKSLVPPSTLSAARF